MLPNMSKLARLLAPFFALTAIVASAEPARMSDAEAAALQLSLNRGLELYRYDQGAWHTTDSLREDIKNLQASGIKGWVVTEVPSGLLATYWREDGSRLRGVYSAIWTGSTVQDRQVLTSENDVLTAEQIDLINAAKTADLTKIERCSNQPFNSVTLPAKEPSDPILVYFLTPQTSTNSIPMGGHYRFSIKDGKVVDQRAFTKSCIELSLVPDDNSKGKPEALVISHLLDPVPTEIHVFSVFASQVPIYVMTTANEHVWSAEVSGGRPRVRLIK